MKPTSAPNPGPILSMLAAHQQAMALQAAVKLDLFTAIADGAASAAALAKKLTADERGVAVLCDYLCISGLLQKQADRYALSPSADMFLNQHSPASLASVSAWEEFSAANLSADDVVSAVRQGGSGTAIAPPETWVLFARSMGPTARMAGQVMARAAAGPLLHGVARPRVLDVAGGHGFYGIAVAQHVPAAEVTILDAAPVLEVAREHAGQAGVAARYHTLAGSVLPGSAGELKLDSGWNLVLITGFLHMFGPATVEAVLVKARPSLAPGGAVIVVDFLPNDDRISPPMQAAFSLRMLLATTEGRAYTEAEFRNLFAKAGFPHVDRYDLEPSPLSALVARP